MQSAAQLSLPRGTCPVHVFGNDQPTGIVVIYMDAFGPRPALFELATRFEQAGYTVWLPHLFYAHLPFEPFDPATVFAGGADMQRLMNMFRSLTQADVDADVNALLAHIVDARGVNTPIACVGYCMGGRFALTAAAASDQVAFAASIHGSTLAVDAADSPHRRLAGRKSRIYVGVAGVDPMFDGVEEGRLASALRTGDVDHVIESYAGAYHGFAMSDLPVYNPQAAERQWGRVSQHIDEMFVSRRSV